MMDFARGSTAGRMIRQVSGRMTVVLRVVTAWLGGPASLSTAIPRAAAMCVMIGGPVPITGLIDGSQRTKMAEPGATSSRLRSRSGSSSSE